MRAWIARNRTDLKMLSSRDLIVLFGADTPAILDRPSWLDASETRFLCTGYQFGSVYVRRQGKVAIFAAPVDLEATIDGSTVLSKTFLSSMWMRSAVRRKWQLTERLITGRAHDAQLTKAVRSMQHWR